MTTPTAATRTMTAWRQRRYGRADAVTAETVPVPVPGPKDVLVRVEAVSINSGDIHLMHGEPRLVRLFFGLRRPRVAGRGMDLAGTVAAVGGAVTGLRVGDRVVGAHQDTLAEFVAVPRERLSVIPAGVSMTDAAALPIAGNTALTILDRCRVGEGSRVLVVGGGGGVGTLTVQLAAARGAEVWVTCGDRAQEPLRALGAARTFDYRVTDLGALPPDSFDAVIDIAGQPPLALMRGLLRRGGAIALVGGDGGRILGPVGRILRSLFVARPGRRFVPITAVTRTPVTERLLEEAASGALTPLIERTYGLDEAGAALAHVEAGHTVGKVLVQVVAG